jgi:ABC-type transport system involved in cytochrome c biogenesis permease subunit
MRHILFLVLILVLTASDAFAATGDPVEPPRAPWSDEAVGAFALLPVQDGGRVKPLDTFAQFRLLRMNGKRSFETPSGEKLGPTAWLLDAFFYPEVARTYRMFQVRDDRALIAIGVRVPDRKKSDRYSYDELLPGAGKLFSEASRIAAIEEKNRDFLDSQLFALAVNVRDFEALLHGMEFARCELPTDTTPFLREVFGEQKVPGLAHFLARLPRLREGLEARLDGLSEDERGAETKALEALSSRLQECEERSSAMAIFPPEDPKEEEWRFLGGANGAVETAFGGASSSTTAELIGAWETLDRTKDDRIAFQRELDGLLGRLSGIAGARGEYSKVPMEVSFYRAKLFTRALVAFLGAFVLLCVSWLAPRWRWAVKGVWGLALLGSLLVVAGVTWRCLIRERPPISTLYETILFVTGTGTLVLFLVERFHKRGIALSLVPVWGAVGLFLSMKYELKEAATAGDTMPSLVAVLDTNFWLATHVTTITMGYAAGLVAAVLGKRWLLGKMLGHRKGDTEYYRSITRMTYGVVCFGLIFSVVGTILGGVWANYSWGRFWGWDPKENGALLICLAELLILHLRMGGYIRDFGLALMAVLTGMVVAFSWFGVNLLNVGLHSYGFTAGIARALYTYYGLCLAIVAAALIWRAVTERAERAPAGAEGVRA